VNVHRAKITPEPGTAKGMRAREHIRYSITNCSKYGSSAP